MNNVVTTDEPRTSVEVPRLVRFRPCSSFFSFEPPQFCKCGGEINVQDHHTKALRNMRYEAWCTKCKTCDPNGWGTQAEVVANSPRYFKGLEQWPYNDPSVPCDC